MGLFGKKKNKNELGEIFDSFGMEENKAQDNSRKGTAEKFKQDQAAQQLISQISDRFDELRKSINRMGMSTDFNVDEYISELSRCKGMLGTPINNNANPNARMAVDRFILAFINDAYTHCNSGNIVSLDACISLISRFAGERSNPSAYYADPKFCQWTLRKNRLEVERQKEYATYNELAKRLARLGEKYNNPAFAMQKTQIAGDVARIKQEAASIKSRIDKLEGEIKTCDLAVDQIIKNLQTHMDDNKFDHMEALDDILEIKSINEADETTSEKMNEKLGQNNRKVSSASLGFDDSIMEQKPQHTELSEDDFKL